MALRLVYRPPEGTKSAFFQGEFHAESEPGAIALPEVVVECRGLDCLLQLSPMG
jgi:hypothetical protein